MSADPIQEHQEHATLHDLAELSPEKLGLSSKAAADPFAAMVDYLRVNPWRSVAGAAVLGVALVALSRRRSEPRKLEVIRDWLDEARENLPSRRAIDSLADSTGVSCLLRRLGRKLHLAS